MKMVESVFFKPVSICLAIVTLIESLAWAVLSLSCILCYSDVIKFDQNMSFGLKFFTNSLYDLYLSGRPSIPDDNRAVIPNTFNILMWIYFMLSLLLFFCSATHLTVLCTKSKLRKINLSTVIWLTFVYIVCLFDIITCVLFSIDYHLIKDYITVNSAEDELTLAASMTLLILAAKGFILWILNFSLSIFVTILFKKKVENEPILQVVNPNLYGRNNTAYDAYGDVTFDPQILPNSTETEAVEEHFNNLPRTNSGRQSVSSLNSFGINDDTVTVTSTFPRVPRVHTDSYETPRSLMSTNPSPPSVPSTHLYHEPKSIDGRSSVYEKEDDNDEAVLNNPSYLSGAFAQPRRFTLAEPTPDYF